MKCYFTIDPITNEKVFIPMCYSTIYTLDKEDCTCPEPLTEHYFEKKRFNDIVKLKNETIKDMQVEIKHLNKIIKNLTAK